MPRRKPPAHLVPKRTGISLPTYIFNGAEKLIGTELELSDFSAVVAAAIEEYARKHHPELLAKEKAAALAAIPADSSLGRSSSEEESIQNTKGQADRIKEAKRKAAERTRAAKASRTSPAAPR
jgi:hypothetical protein